LLETGLRSFSVAPAALARVKATISTVGELPAPLPA
jgi:phosphoenolpyruvate-protein kinase (PTS system EI component)